MSLVEGGGVVVGAVFELEVGASPGLVGEELFSVGLDGTGAAELDPGPSSLLVGGAVGPGPPGPAPLPGWLAGYPGPPWG